MNFRILSLLIPAVVLSGCGAEVSKPVDARDFRIGAVSSPVYLTDVSSDMETKQVSARVVAGSEEWGLQLAALTEGPYTNGATAALTDLAGNILFSVSFGHDSGGNFWVKEATATDYLVFSVTESGGRVREEYDANGNVAAFEYAAMAPEVGDKAARYYRRGGSVDSAAPEVQELVGVLGEFDAWFTPYTGSSLHSNEAGELLAQILSEPGVIDWLLADGTPSPEKSRAAERVCSGAWLCTALKCRFGGGIANPLCVACAGTSLACSIASFACAWVVDCD